MTCLLEQSFKQQGDDYYKLNQFNDAAEYYTKAINIDPYFFTAISNRAACYLQLSKYTECIDDCTNLLSNLYLHNDEKSENVIGKGSLILKALTRRAEAYFSLEDFRNGRRI
jgi:tetratricopeptide (TPR) repeat protein